MKSFYEMVKILEDYDSWLQAPYQDAEEAWSRRSTFSTVLGDDDGEPFTVEVDVNDGDWRPMGSIWVDGYVPDGSENPASQPVSYTAGQKARDGSVIRTTGTEFKNPGRDLELLPARVRDAAIAWINKEVTRTIDRR